MEGDQNDDQHKNGNGDGGDGNGNPDGNQNPPKSKFEGLTSEQLLDEIRKRDELVAKLRKTEKDYGSVVKERDDAKAKLDEIAQADLSEKDREKLRADNAEKERDRFREEVRQRSLRAAVQIAALKMRFRAPEDAFGLLTLDGVEYDDHDEPKGVEELVKKLAEEKDYLVDKGNAAAGPPGGDRSSRREGKITPEEDREILRNSQATRLRAF